jgi:hypothetical protein
MASPRTIHITEDQEVVCPACGVTILNSEELHEQPSCEHVRFVYANGECFEYIEPELQVVLAEEEAKADEQNEVFDMWDALRRHCAPGTVILEQKGEGMACGAISFTVWFGIRVQKGRILGC